MSFSRCPAKTYTRPSSEVVPGRSVITHCQIVGEVAKGIVARMPPFLREIIPEGAPLVAGAHDVGKVSPCFVEKIHLACTENTSPFQPPGLVNPKLESQWNGHAGVSQLAASAMDVPELIPEILGQHHGFAPSVGGMRASDECFGGVSWQQERTRLVSELKQRLDLEWPDVETAAQRRLLAGLTSVSDWIGSGEFFLDPETPWEDNIAASLDSAGFVAPRYRSGLSFNDIFGFEPREAQTLLPLKVIGRGTYVLEAPMGLGKTEAALYAAYRLLENGEASGVYFALPTQLTSNKIFERFSEFLSRILSEECQHRSLLLHSNAWLLDTDMGEEGAPGGSWFNQSKRGLLAPFAVGTVDQALMAAMNVKHGSVRAFGLAGKVVILDEVHSYDTYTGTILDSLVSLLRSLECTVIILSATLCRTRRKDLVRCDVNSDDYPLVTSIPSDGNIDEAGVDGALTHLLRLQMVPDPRIAVEAVLTRAIQGQQVLWIENTVKEAQERYLDLAARAQEAGVECGLLHSRYTPDHREVRENHWVRTLGNRGWQRRAEKGRILIGTQVLEQSLDIDADLLVSRFAPSDMLLQRMGRLWRHQGTPRPESAICETWVVAPELADACADPVKCFGSTAFVYSPYVLCRSLEVWHQRTSLRFPVDIRPIIESTYLDRPESGEMARWLSELESGTHRRAGRTAMRRLAWLTLADGGKTLPESKAQTRYSETDRIDVLLLRKVAPDADKRETSLTLLDGKTCVLPWRRSGFTRKAWRELTVNLSRQVVGVNVGDAPLPIRREALQKLGFQHCFYLGHPDSPNDESILRIALVDESGLLRGFQGSPTHSKYKLVYREDMGYRTMEI